MKKIILLLLVAVISVPSACAANLSRYFDQGYIYSGSSFPVDVAKEKDDSVPLIEGLRRGEASTKNILGLVEVGNRGIQKAARNGEITKIHYVDTKVRKVYVPFLFIPIYVKQTTTIVYGE